MLTKNLYAIPSSRMSGDVETSQMVGRFLQRKILRVTVMDDHDSAGFILKIHVLALEYVHHTGHGQAPKAL